MEAIEFNGKTTDDAIRKATEHFNLPLSRLHVEVLTAGSDGFLGILGGKKAKVLVAPLASTAKQEVADVVREMIDPRGESPSDGASPKTPPSSKEKPAQAKRAEESPEVVQSAVEVLTRLMEPLDDNAKIQGRATAQGIFLEINGGEVGMIIGRRGQTLEALQYLTNRIVGHMHGRPLRIHVDAGGYHRRRRETLEEMARRMAEKAKATGKPVALGPFSAPERRIIHLTLRPENGLSTASRGRGELKKVIISPRH